MDFQDQIINKLHRIEDKIDTINDRLSSIERLDAVQNEQLSIHIKRTEIIEEKLIPIEEHVSVVNGIAKLLVIVLTLIAAYLKLR